MLSVNRIGVLVITLIAAASIVLPALSQELPEGAILNGLTRGASPFGGAMWRLADKLGGTAASGGPAAQARATLGREPTKDEIYYYTALDCQSSGNSKGFIKYINMAISAAPRNWVYRSLLGDEYRREAKRQKAIDTYLAAAKAAEQGDISGATVTRKWAADQMLRLGRSADAEKTYEKSLAQFSAYAPEIRQRTSDPRVRQAWMAAKSDAMRQLLMIKQKLAPGRSAVATKLKSILDVETMPSGDVDVIREADPAVVQMEPGTSGGDHLLLARGLCSSGKCTPSLIEALAATELSPKSALLWRSVGYLYLRQSRPAEAAAAYAKAGYLGDSEASDVAARIRTIATEMHKPAAEVSVSTGKRTGISRSVRKN